MFILGIVTRTENIKFKQGRKPTYFSCAGGPTRFNNFGDWLLIDDLYFHINRFVILEDVNHSSAMCNSHPEKGLGLHTPVS